MPTTDSAAPAGGNADLSLPGGGGGGRGGRYQWPGAPAWVACFCAAAALLTLGGYVRTHSLARDNARETVRRLEDMQSRILTLEAELAGALARLDDAERREDERSRLGVLPGHPERLQATVFDVFDRAGKADHLPPLPPLAQPLPLTEAESAAEVPVEQVAEITALDHSLKRVTIDRGREHGVRNGQKLPVYRGNVFIGDARVIMVYDAMATCQIESSSREFLVGDWVRLAAPPQ